MTDGLRVAFLLGGRGCAAGVRLILAPDVETSNDHFADTDVRFVNSKDPTRRCFGVAMVKADEEIQLDDVVLNGCGLGSGSSG